MKLIETESSLKRLEKRSGGTSSPAQRGESLPKTLVAPRALARRVRALRSSVWLPVLAKGAALLLGMLALAAVGASSLAHGSGVPLPARSASAPRLATRAAASLAFPFEMQNATGLETPPNDAGIPPKDTGPEPTAPPSAAITADGKIILNLADANDLRHLPGIGVKRAAAILALRAKLGGRFKRVAELLRVKGIGAKGLKKLEPHVVLDAPKPP